LFGASDEVSLGVDFKQNADFSTAVNIGRNGALRSDPAGLFGCFGDALFTLPINGGLDVAIDLGEGFFTIEHARAGTLAETLDIRCSYHFRFSSEGPFGRKKRVGFRPQRLLRR
jgi:hypothetical protein